ncbi:uncharacterized protein BO80DRAFT_425815 [Aspergillus ibericus CBS 121593]|uniref:Uncharacterized protein n=1 Tax=Aspergillus ibericus CBS 121593 TaxID=1448316 RepID=A0A395H051_9EURO|nr:hypothetical protein BO80DRAFT_425815 [Aspergillus ibericus CBS 121593]RAL00318.1 hypothetical protein BO80DRAFT_425815 [Aspergillus ibericus CBS 121593]
MDGLRNSVASFHPSFPLFSSSSPLLFPLTLPSSSHPSSSLPFHSLCRPIAVSSLNYLPVHGCHFTLPNEYPSAPFLASSPAENSERFAEAKGAATGNPTRASPLRRVLVKWLQR